MLYPSDNFLVIDERVEEVCAVLGSYTPSRFVEFIYSPSEFYRLHFSPLKFEEKFSLVATLDKIGACLYNLVVSKRTSEANILLKDIALMEIPIAEEYPIDAMKFRYDSSYLELTLSQIPKEFEQSMFKEYGIWKEGNVISIAFHQMITLGFCFKQDSE